MSTPKQTAANRLSTLKGPSAHPPPKASPPQASPPKTRLDAQSQAFASDQPPGAEANFVQAQSNQARIGFVPSFCLTADPIYPNPGPPANEGPSTQVLEPIGDWTGEAPETGFGGPTAGYRPERPRAPKPISFKP